MATVEEKRKDAPAPKVTRYVKVTRVIPLCPVHKVPMIRYSSGTGEFRYYGCNIGNCTCTGRGTTKREEF